MTFSILQPALPFGSSSLFKKPRNGLYVTASSRYLLKKKVLACVYDYRKDCFLLYSGVRVGPALFRCMNAPEPGRMVLLFTFLCEEIPGMCMEWSSFIRVRGFFSKDTTVAGTGGSWCAPLIGIPADLCQVSSGIIPLKW